MGASTEGLSKPSDLAQAQALAEKVHGFEKACIDHLKVLETANAAAQKMTTHKEADNEVASLRERYTKVKAVADEWVKKVDTLVKGGLSWITLSQNSMPGSLRIKQARVRTSSLWRRWNLPSENLRTSSRRKRNWLKTCKTTFSFHFRFQYNFKVSPKKVTAVRPSKSNTEAQNEGFGSVCHSATYCIVLYCIVLCILVISYTYTLVIVRLSWL